MQAAGGAATIALGTGVIADISSPHERGKFVGVFQFAGTFSTASELGPLPACDRLSADCSQSGPFWEGSSLELRAGGRSSGS